TFKVYLPQADEPIPSATLSAQLRIPRGSETVLLVEDEDSVRCLARHVLELAGYRVLEAGDGLEALRLVQTHADPIHLLLTAVVSPRPGAPPPPARLLAATPRLKVLFLSGYTNETVVRHGVCDATYPFLQKPFTTAALAQKVREVLDEPGR